MEDANFRAWAIEFPNEYLEAVNAEPAVQLRMEWLKVAAGGGQEILRSANTYAAPPTAAFAGVINDLPGQG